MRKILIAAALILTPATAYAEDWVLVTVATDKSSAMFVDVDSLNPAGEKVRTGRVLGVSREDKGSFAAAVAHMSFDCEGRRRLIISVTAYDASARELGTSGESPWREVLPESNYWHVLVAMCGEKPIAGAHYGATPPIVSGREMLIQRSTRTAP